MWHVTFYDVYTLEKLVLILNMRLCYSILRLKIINNVFFLELMEYMITVSICQNIYIPINCSLPSLFRFSVMICGKYVKKYRLCLIFGLMIFWSFCWLFESASLLWQNHMLFQSAKFFNLKDWKKIIQIWVASILIKVHKCLSDKIQYKYSSELYIQDLHQ